MAAISAAAVTSSLASARIATATSFPSSRKNCSTKGLCTRRPLLVVRAEKKEFSQNVKDGANKAAEEIKAGAEDIIGKMRDVATGRATDPKKGEVRTVTNANISSDARDQAGKIVEEVKEAVEGVIDNVKNSVGGNEGYDASSQKGAYTTPQREALKGRLDPAKSGDRPPQKTVDLDNPFDKK